MRVARQVGEHGLRPGERRLGVDDPTLLADGRQVALERPPITETELFAEELKPAGFMQLDQTG